jgi:hypothetical protein
VGDNTGDSQAPRQPPEPSPGLKKLGDRLGGAWVYPGGGGYASTSTRNE